jgi:hypothetical protein
MPTTPPTNDLVISYMRLRQALGVVALLLPFVLALGAWRWEGLPWLDSISAYYYTRMRDVFVGTMCAVGIFLYCYRGHDRQDNVLSTIAGIAAAGIGFFPMAPAYSEVLLRLHPDIEHPNCYVPTGPIGYHIYAVATFFAIMAYMAIFRFTKTDQVPVTTAKRSRNRVYVLCGVAMVVCFAWIGILKSQSKEARIVVPEAGAVIAFAIAWLTKGQAILPDRD